VVRLDVTGRSAIVITSPEGGDLALWLVPASDLLTVDVPVTTLEPGGTALHGALEPGLPATIKVAGSGKLLVQLPSQATVGMCNAVVS
jgi:hypothetical protein